MQPFSVFACLAPTRPTAAVLGPRSLLLAFNQEEVTAKCYCKAPFLTPWGLISRRGPGPSVQVRGSPILTILSCDKTSVMSHLTWFIVGHHREQKLCLRDNIVFIILVYDIRWEKPFSYIWYISEPSGVVCTVFTPIKLDIKWLQSKVIPRIQIQNRSLHEFSTSIYFCVFMTIMNTIKH